MSEIVFKSSIFTQTWDCDVLGWKKPCGKSLQESGLDVQTWTSNCKLHANALVTRLLEGRGSREMLKNLELNLSNI